MKGSVSGPSNFIFRRCGLIQTIDLMIAIAQEHIHIMGAHANDDTNMHAGVEKFNFTILLCLRPLCI